MGVVAAAVALVLPNFTLYPLSSNGFFYSTGVGNAGNVQFSIALNGTSLVGSIDLQSVGIATFDASAAIVPPASGKATDFWPVTGTMTSPNAGTINLSGPNTNLCFDPINRSFQGYGWNNWVGRVYFGAGVCSAAGAVAQTGAAFLGKVKIIGNAGGTTIFDSLYAQGARFNTNAFNNTLQRVRKNVGTLSRNLTSVQKNTTTNSTFNNVNPVIVGDKIVFVNETSTLKTLVLTDSLFNSVRSIIVIGGDVKIAGTGGIVFSPPSSNSKAVIVIKNNNNIGWDIYIDQYVSRIQATLLAEGTVYSGNGPGDIYNDSTADVTNLPLKQLWVQGSILSRNTIGGSVQGAAICPLPGDTCDFQTSIRYDLNYFRAISIPFDPAKRAYKDSSLDEYTVIIDYDLRNTTNPPPWFEK